MAKDRIISLTATYTSQEAANEALRKIAPILKRLPKGTELSLELGGRKVDYWKYLAEQKPKKTKKPKPNGFVFLFDEDGDSFEEETEESTPHFFVTSIEFWRKNRYISDSMHDFPVPDGFRVCQEACLEFEGSRKEATKRLRAAGFQEVQWGEKI